MLDTRRNHTLTLNDAIDTIQRDKSRYHKATMSAWFRLEAVPNAVFPLVYVAASAAIKLLAVSATGRRRYIPSRAEHVGRVTQIAVYPAKSVDGLQVDKAVCTYTGLKLTDAELYDR